jgi:hypothetical protein
VKIVMELSSCGKFGVLTKQMPFPVSEGLPE